ncbi:ATP-binding protein [Mesorhizobium sp. M7D.F.Ca.US.005.01.1.1]|uniref:ATP-binding protein n=1 Tax=Mesorhizobium sp. M7D.F.Ca.US.005.01.1.1 TaxID=2493678 RepID=UPI000F75F0D6|nr:ATP-binding protein [Mesorhizobium sp. M7D.F.Ca.US.005.01.1.1]AZO44949.1 ATP-binding protein [Mesorhizobium sp. M7D.F.Ca.US.005.01.1.1]
MVAINIDFQRIRSFGGSQNHAFEELCTQLAALEPRAANAVFHRKGVGADAGVECFVQQLGGSETGWQAKYFFDFGASQIAQLDKSIQTALAKHPRLNRYIVCVPIDLFDQRVGKAKSQLERWKDWVKKWKATATTMKRKLAIEFWGHSEIVERLGRDNPLYSGRAAFWFDETFLTSAWFTSRFELARSGLGQRYTPDTNIELPIRRTILGLCRDPSLLDQVQAWGEKLEEARYDVIKQLGYLSFSATLAKEITGVERTTGALSSLLSATPVDAAYAFPVAEITSLGSDALAAGALAMRAVRDKSPADPKDEKGIDYLSREMRDLEEALDRIIDGVNGDNWQLVNGRRALVTGPAGIGKSHLFGDAVDHQVTNGRPSLLILGGTLIDDDPWAQIVKQLDLSISTEKFLGALDAAAEAAHTRAVIFIDAINERHGIAIWSHRLAAFLKTIENFPRVAVALSCRSTYVPYVIPDGVGADLARIEHVGFAGRAAEAARYYLDKRGIVRMAAPNLIPEFENPLFLKTCCDFLEKEGLCEFPRGLRGVTEIFKFYSQAVAKSVERQLGLDHKLGLVSRALETLAAAFDQGERGYLEYEKAAALMEDIFPAHGVFDRSLLTRLISEGVLADEPVTGDDGNVAHIVRFSFERYSDHRIARQLLDAHLDSATPANSFLPGTPLQAYLENKKAYEHAGVLEAMAIQLPERCGLELPDAVSGKQNKMLISRAFLESVLWREQRSFTQRTIDLLKEVSKMSDRDETLRTLIAVASEPENAFNAEYLHSRLIKLSMPERDRIWSIYVAQEGDEEDSPIQTLIGWTLQNGLEAMDDKRAGLAAIALSWLFSTSHRAIRDRATKSLAALLATRLTVAADLIDRFSRIDDLYILDRVIGAAYGAALQGMGKDGLPELAEAAFRCVFDQAEPLAHVLIRDHARGIIELAYRRNALPATFDMVRVRPPYRSPGIEDVPEAVIESYKQEYAPGKSFGDAIVSSCINDGDFARYVVDHPVRKFSAYSIDIVGQPEEQVYSNWSLDLASRLPAAAALLHELIAACDAWRANQGPIGFGTLNIKFVDAEDPEEEEVNKFEQAVDQAEARLKDALGETEWAEYNNRARALVRKDLRGAKRYYSWPPSFDRLRARRWVCKRAHDLGWTPDLFGEFERSLGYNGRNSHRVERIGKKYQWIAFHELLARLGDNFCFVGWNREDGTQVFQGPWQVSRRDIDPSLFASQTPKEAQQSDRTWWMPAQVTMRPMSPNSRLAWLDSGEDIINDASLLSVTEPKTNREWLVVNEFERWNQWGMREGERTLDRYTAFEIRCMLVRASDRAKVVKGLSGKIFRDRFDLPELDKPSEGYIGEYPWHPLYRDVPVWLSPADHNELTAKVQPTVTDYQAERGGHDYSIEDSFHVNVPAPGLVAGLGLHLSNGRDLSYSDDAGKVIFFDPSTREPGPGAALVDRNIFLAFLAREKLDAIWVIAGEKEVHGGRKHREGYGGSKSFTSVYWLTKTGFRKTDFEERQRPTTEQLTRFYDEAGARATATRKKKPAPVSATASTRGKKPKPRSTPSGKKPASKPESPKPDEASED